MCKAGNTFEQLDLCPEEEYCVGPLTPDTAELFSRSTFCSKGTSNTKYLISKDWLNLVTNLRMNEEECA